MLADPDLIHSCWIVEAARLLIVQARGVAEAASPIAERTEILAAACAELGVSPNRDYAETHSRWMEEICGTEEETGALGWMLLHRFGRYVDGHARPALDTTAQERLVELGKLEESVIAGLGLGMPPMDDPKWPQTAAAKTPGAVSVRFALIGDPHIGSAAGDVMAPVAVAEAELRGVDIAVALGDMTQDGREDYFREAAGLFRSTNPPALVTLGNHDMWGGRGADIPVGRQRFEAAFARPPYAEFELHGFRIVVLCSADPAPSPFPPFDLYAGGFTDQPNESVPGGSFSEEMLEWMETLHPGPPTFIALHHPPYPYLGFPPLVFGLNKSSTEALDALAQRLGALAIFCGHTHRAAISNLGEALVVEVPSIKEWPFGIGIVEAGPAGWSYNLVPLPQSYPDDAATGPTGLLLRRYARGPDEARALARASAPS